MTGIHYIKLKNKKISFNIRLERKITIVRGYSGTGKSTLVKVVDQFIRENFMYKNNSTAKLNVLDSDSIKSNIYTLKYICEDEENNIVVMDEDTLGLSSNELANAINKSDCYFVIVTRERLSGIPYSINSVMKMVTDKNNVPFQDKCC